MKKLKIKSIENKKVLLEPFSHNFISKEYLSWMNDKETTKFIHKAKKDISDKELADKRAAKKAAMQTAAARKAEIRSEIAKESIETIDIIGPTNMHTVVNNDGLWKGTEQIIEKENEEADGTPSSVEENLSNWKDELKLRWE